MKEVLFGVAIVALLVGGLLGLVFWTYADFGDRCERAGGILVTQEVCVDRETRVLLMVLD